MRTLLVLLAFLAACGGATTTPRPRQHTARGSCDLETDEQGATLVSEHTSSFGFSLPAAPAQWTVNCDADGDRLVRADIESTGASATVTRDANPQETDERGYLQDYMRDVRRTYIDAHVEVSLPEVESYRGSPIGVFETRSVVDGAEKVHVVAISLMATEDGHVLRFVVVLPAEGRFGHPHHDRAARRAMATAYSFGAL